MNRFKFILFIFILLIIPNVSAAEFNMNSYTSASLNGTKNRYAGTEFMYTGGGNQTWTFGTRYDGRLNNIITYYDYPFEGNTTYRFTYNMATNDFNNNFSSSWWWDCSEQNPNPHVFIPTYVSYKKVQFSITPSENTTCIKVELAAKSNGGGITQIKNWNLSSITLYDPDFQSGSGSGQGTTPIPTPTPGGNQDIINNNNQNTQDIINNQNDNTNSIIENNNEVGEKIVDAIDTIMGNKCGNMLNFANYEYKTDYVALSYDKRGLRLITQNGAWQYVKYKIPIEHDTTYYFKGEFISENANQIFLSLSYNGNDIVGDRFWNYEPYSNTWAQQLGEWSTNFTNTNNDYVYLGIWVTKSSTSGNNAVYLDMMFDDLNMPYCLYGSASSKLDDTNDILNNLKETMQDETVPDIPIDLNVASDTPISDLLLMPLNLINKLQTLSNANCSAYHLPFDFFGGNYGIDLPCIDLEDYLGHDVYTILDVILCFYFAYEIGLLCISIYNNVTSLNDGFEALYEPKHGAPDGASSYIGKHGGGKR